MGDYQSFKKHLMKGNAEGVRNNLRGEFVDKIVDDNYGEFPIHIACRDGFVEVAKLLLDRNCNTECETKSGWRPIHYASWGGHSEIVKLLLNRNCNTECETKSGWRPIHCASLLGHSEIVKLLLDRNCNTECEDKLGNRPIHCASCGGHSEIVKLLLDRNCIIECETKSGWRPIHCASCCGHSEIVKLLLDRNCNTECEDESGNRPIHYASRNGHSEIVKLLLDRNCNTECETKSGMRPIHYASRDGHSEIVKLLLRRKCRINCKNKDGESPLDIAKKYNHFDCVKLLTHVEKLFAIIERDDPIEIEKLFISCQFIKENIYTGLNVLEMAMTSNADKIIKWILNKSINNKEIDEVIKELTAKDKPNANLLKELSCQHSVGEMSIPFAQPFISLTVIENSLTLSLKFHRTIFPCLLKKLDLDSSNAHDGDNNSLLHLAVKCLQPDICSSLLNAGARVDSVNNFGNSPLLEMFADREIPVEDDTLNKLFDITKILIVKGADVNFKSSNGISAFQSASNIKSEKLMVALVSNHPRLINFSSNDFQTAFLNQWFIYAELLIELLPDDFLSFAISNDTFQSCESAGTNLIKSLFNKASSALQQSVIENLLYKAVNSNDVELFDHLIGTEISAPKSLGNGENLLTFILQERKIEFAWKLLDSVNRGKFVKLRNVNNQIPLQIAIEIEEMDLVNALIIETKDCDSENEGGTCALTQLLEKISISNNVNFKRKLISAIKSIILSGGDIYKMTSRGQHRIIDACTDSVAKEEIERYHRNNTKPSTEENKPDNEIAMCKICQNKQVNIVFQCGHLTCDLCSDQLFECPFCKADIVTRTKMFFS